MNKTSSCLTTTAITPSSAPNASAPPTVVPPAPVDDDEEEALAIPGPLRADAVSRIANKEIREVEDHVRRKAGVNDDSTTWTAWVERYFETHRDYNMKVLQPLGEAFRVDAWRIETMVDRIANKGVLGLSDGVPEGWEQGRRLEVAAIIDECLCAGVMRDAA